jgi:hypothetical protein
MGAVYLGFSSSLEAGEGKYIHQTSFKQYTNRSEDFAPFTSVYLYATDLKGQSHEVFH